MRITLDGKILIPIGIEKYLWKVIIMQIVFPNTNNSAYMSVPIVDMTCDCMKDTYDDDNIFRLFHGKACDDEGNEYYAEVERVVNAVLEKIKSGAIEFRFISNFDPKYLIVGRDMSISYNDGVNYYKLTTLHRYSIELSPNDHTIILGDTWCASLFEDKWYIIWVGSDEHATVEGILDAETTALEDLVEYIEYKLFPSYHHLMND